MATPENQPELSFFCDEYLCRFAPTRWKVISERNIFCTWGRQLAAQVGLAASIYVAALQTA
jgi:hypothetical protein